MIWFYTQQDPIGIAGGLNVYGFAGGDPVNFSDPFGLCPPEDDDLTSCPGFFTALLSTVGGVLGGFGGGTGGAALCAAGGPAAIPCGAAGAAAGAAKGAAIGGAVGLTLDGLIFMSQMRQGEAIDRAESILGGDRGVNHHLDLIRGNPGARDAAHHAGEVRGMLKSIERLTKRMRGRTQRQWRELVENLRAELDDLVGGR